MKKTSPRILKSIRETIVNLQTLLKSPEPAAVIHRIAEIMAYTLRNSHRIYFCGNGGSAADSQHLAGEFVGRFQMERAALPAISLTTDTTILTAIGNDYGFEKVFSRQVEALGEKGDLIFIFSTSGRAVNTILAAKKARELGVKVVALLGKDGGPLKDLADLFIIAPGNTTARIQEVHILIGHILTEIVEETLVKEGIKKNKTAEIDGKINTLKELQTIVKTLKEAGKKVVFTNGCFDLLHQGHLKLFQSARAEGDILIVGLNSDSSVRKIKGPGRPVVPEEERAGILASLSLVDYVVIFKESTPLKLIKALLPDVLVKGADYTAEKVVGRDVVEKSGGKVVLVPLAVKRSTTALINRIKNTDGRTV